MLVPEPLAAIDLDQAPSGLILKPLDSPYPTDESEDSWLVLKPQDLTLLGVLMYIERGPAGRIEQVTAGVWRGEELVPIAKVAASFSPAEAEFVETFVKENTLERFGPVRTIKAEIVVEIAYEGVDRSPRRKAGIALRSPRIVAVGGDAAPDSASNLSDLLHDPGRCSKS
jgi:DNA ligase-1